MDQDCPAEIYRCPVHYCHADHGGPARFHTEAYTSVIRHGASLGFPSITHAHARRIVPRRAHLSSCLPILLGPSVQASEHVLIDIAARVRAWRGPWRWMVHQAGQRHDTASLLPRLGRVRTFSALARSRGSVRRWVLVLRRSATGRRGCGRAPPWVRFTVNVRRGQALPVLFLVQPSLWDSASVFWRRRVERASGRG